MHCEPFEYQGTRGIICGRGRRPKKEPGGVQLRNMGRPNPPNGAVAMMDPITKEILEAVKLEG